MTTDSTVHGGFPGAATGRGASHRAIRFAYKPRKAAQAAAWMLNRAGRKMTLLELIKLLYLADREMLVRTGAPITGDGMVSMPNGPALSTTYDLIRAEARVRPMQPMWDGYVTRGSNNVLCPSVAGPEQDAEAYDELSDADLEVLEATWNGFGGYGITRLVSYAHSHLPEWEEVPLHHSKPIDPSSILETAAWPAERIEAARRDADASRTFAKLFASG